MTGNILLNYNAISCRTAINIVIYVHYIFVLILFWCSQSREQNSVHLINSSNTINCQELPMCLLCTTYITLTMFWHTYNVFISEWHHLFHNSMRYFCCSVNGSLSAVLTIYIKLYNWGSHLIGTMYSSPNVSQLTRIYCNYPILLAFINC